MENAARHDVYLAVAFLPKTVCKEQILENVPGGCALVIYTCT
jgi:hypothetical protein